MLWRSESRFRNLDMLIGWKSICGKHTHTRIHDVSRLGSLCRNAIHRFKSAPKIIPPLRVTALLTLIHPDRSLHIRVSKFSGRLNDSPHGDEALSENIKDIDVFLLPQSEGDYIKLERCSLSTLVRFIWHILAGTPAFPFPFLSVVTFLEQKR